MSVTLEDVLSAARVQAASVTGETAGYLALGLLDQVGGAAGRLEGAAAHLAEDGSVSVGRLAEGSASELEADLRAFLGALLASCRGATPSLLRISRTVECRGLLHVIAELEAALIPVNRAAGRRALCRVHRDTSRAKEAGKLVSPKRDEPPVKRDEPPAKRDEPPPAAVVSPKLEKIAAPPAPVRVAPPVQAPRLPLAAAEVAVFRPPSAPAARILLSPPAPPAVTEPEPTPIVGIEPMPVERQSLASEPFEQDATPFLGAWPGALPVVTGLRDAPEHDTQLLPPVLPSWARELESSRPLEPEAAHEAEALDEPPSVAAPVVLPEEPIVGSAAAVVAEVPVETKVESLDVAPPAVFTVVAPPIVPLVPRVLGPRRELTSSSPPETVEMLALAEMETSGSPPEVDEFARLAIESIPDLSAPAPRAALAEEESVVAEEESLAPADDAESDEAAVDETMLEPERSDAPPAMFTFAADDPSPVAPVALPAESPEPPPASVPYNPRQSDVSDLLATFAVAESRSLREISRDLKNLAGIAGTPCPPSVVLKR